MTRSARVTVPALLSVLACAACAAKIEHAGAGGGGTTGTTGSTSSSGGNRGWTECSSPEGYQICTKEGDCPAHAPGCDLCTSPQSPVAICENDAFSTAAVNQCGVCPDGDLCTDDGGIYLCVPSEFGLLYANAGHPESVRYADFGLWTGDPIPEPKSCPTFDGFQICGGHCGGCPTGSFCTGRSPLHPWGMCMPNDSWTSVCDPKGPITGCDACFNFKVQPSAMATEWQGYCLPAATCDAAAAMLPGGGECIHSSKK